MSVLLISYKFSPNDSVGARRWSKFYKYLKLSGIEIKVITRNWKNQTNHWGLNTSNGDDFIKLDSILYHLKSISFLSKLIHFFEIYILHKLFRYTDDGYLFNIKAYYKANKLIKKGNITHLIATSPSNSTAYFAAKLKQKHPHIILIQDFRDAWMQAYETYHTGYNSNHYLYKKEKMMEQYSTKQADVIISVVPEIVNYYKTLNQKSYLITNGFDIDDLPKLPLDFPDHILKKDKINICHFGTLDFGRETEFLKLVKEVSKNQDLLSKLNILLIGNINPLIYKELSNYKNVTHCNQLSTSELHQTMSHADIHLCVNDKILYYAYGSKIFDAFLYKKPILFVTKKQSLSDFIEENCIGIAIDTDKIDLNDLEKKILDLVNQSKTKEFMDSYSMKTETFNIQNITKQLIHVVFSKNNS